MGTYAITLLDLSSLDPDSLNAYAALTEKKYHACLHSQYPSGAIPNTITLAIAATYDGQPVGLALATVLSAMHIVELHYLFVSEPHRNHQIATQLLKRLEEESIKHHTILISYNYPSESTTTPIIEHLLHKLKWNPPQISAIHCHFNQYFDAPWIHLPLELPPDYEEFFWKDLKPEERKYLLELDEQKTFSPFIKEELIEPLNSLGIRYRGHVIGWMIVHRLAPDTVEFDVLFVQKAHQKQGVALRLLRDAILLTLDAKVPHSRFDLVIELVEPSWLAFVKRRLIPYTTSTTYTKQAWRRLK